MEIRITLFCGRSDIHRLILWSLLCFLIGLPNVTNGDCLHNGHAYHTTRFCVPYTSSVDYGKNGLCRLRKCKEHRNESSRQKNNQSVWQPDVCTVCTCQDPVPLCETTVCSDPKCNFTHGEKLELSPSRCCPACTQEKKPCDFRGQSVQHRTDWNTSSCQTCQCLDGGVTCTKTSCPKTPCKPGEVHQMLPGQCCPRCLPRGRICIHDDGTRKPDGSEWYPLPCVKCVCRDGHSRCMPVDCPPLNCPGNSKAIFPGNQCCAVCEAKTCHKDKDIYKEGDTWNEDACTTCTCRNGETVCQKWKCDNTVDCPRGQILRKFKDQCCPQCVRKRGACHMTGSEDRYHGEIWKMEPCEYCTCYKGVVSCQRARCSNIICEQGKEKKKLPNECCPRCVTPKMCFVQGQSYQSGQSWDPDPCSSCECLEGRVTCYKKECPTRCVTYKKEHISTAGICCQRCDTPPSQEVSCKGDCATCHFQNPGVCLSCKEAGKLLQNGRCVDECKAGYYPSLSNECKECHKSCKSCNGRSEHQCISCRQNYYMKNGQCVPHCGEGYFKRNQFCVSCDPLCRNCRGPRDDQCLICRIPGQVVLKGKCVDDCGSRYYLEGQRCRRCSSSCQTCLSDRNHCTSCLKSMRLFNGQCLTNCPIGHYVDTTGKCLACHPSCLECDGPSKTNCTRCAVGKILTDGMCNGTGPCRDGQYLNPDMECLDCFLGCSMCHSDIIRKGSLCSKCQDPNQSPFGSRCYNNCPLGSVLRNGVCFPCESRCRHCDPTGHCLQCFTPFLLSKKGYCVEECGSSTFEKDGRCQQCSKNCLMCQNRAVCLSCKASTLLQDGQCVDMCGEGFITRQESRICEKNNLGPEISMINGIITARDSVVEVTEEIVTVTDIDTPNQFLSVVVEKPPDFGHLIKVDSSGDIHLLEKSSFMIKDLTQRRIHYTQDIQTRDNSDSISLKAFDGQLYSAIIDVPIAIQSNDKMDLVTNKPILTKSGAATVINEEIIAVRPPKLASEDRVVFWILNGPKYGKIIDKISNKDVKSFTLKELKTSAIFYSHHGNDSHKIDMTRILVEYGLNQMYLVLTMKIISEASLLPVVISNTGGQVYVGEMFQITKAMLEAQTQDKVHVASPDVVYRLSPSERNPRNGQVVMVVPTPLSGPRHGWEKVDNKRMSARMSRFTQRDINDGRIFYKNTDTDSVADEMRFEVSDTAQPPNILEDQVFYIQLLSNHTSPLSMPTLAPGVKLSMTIFENQIVPITSTNMAFQDNDTPSIDLEYRITRLLSPKEGSLEHIDSPFKHVLRFTQDDINNNRIIYRPPQDEIGNKSMDVSFSFIVTEGKNIKDLEEHQFTIRVIPVNNNPPHFTHSILNISVLEKGHVKLSPAMMEVIDVDTPKEQLMISLILAPTSGVIEKRLESVKAILRRGDKFPYSDIGNEEIRYLHTGSVLPPRDFVVLSVSDGEHQANMTINISVVKIDKTAPQMLPTASCQFNISEGATFTVTREEILFSDSDDKDENIQIVLDQETTHGYFDKNGIKTHEGGGFSQEDINQGNIKFHAEQEIGYKPITELVYLNVSDSSGNILPNQILSISIQPVDNLAPIVTFGPNFFVDEGGQQVISSDSLKVMDIDTRVADLTVVIKRQPIFGKLFNVINDGKIGRRNGDLESFALTDLLDGNLAYANTNHNGKEPSADVFLFFVTDGKNKSPVQRFNITILPINDEKPSIVTEQLFVEEGHYVTLTNSSMYVVDLDSKPRDLLFTLEATPVNGVLLKKSLPVDTLDKAVVMKDKDTFTYHDILQELIVYQHDDGETTQDSVQLRLTDGDFTDFKVINIIVGVVNDETPRVTINRGLRVKAGTKTPLTTRDLKATDLDSEDSEIQYTLIKDPSAGTLQLDNRDVSYILTSSSSARSFKQKDIDKGFIFYKHTMGEMVGNILFKFKLSDPEGNELIDQDFFITVLEDRLMPLEIINKEFYVTEGQAVKLTTDYLSYTDFDSEPGSLMYTVLDGPQLGHLELTGQPGIPVVTFSQSDLAAKSVVYVHTTPEEHYLDKFIFSVSDGRNELVSSFYIRIKPIDDAIPTLLNKGLRVQEGMRKLITEFNLKATDKDTREQFISFTIIDPPIHGSLDLLTQHGIHKPVQSFTMEDVYENRVSYQHDGSETVSDTFSFLVDDGTNKAFTMQQQDQPSSGSRISTPQDFQITVLAMDDGMPVLDINLGIQFLEANKYGQIGNVISSQELKTTDEDTTPEGIVYVITKPPKWGILESKSKPGESLLSFTQDDVDKGEVFYKLTNKTNEHRDTFVFSVGDSRPDVLTGNEFHIMWSEISFSKSAFNVSEKDSVLQVPIIRRGNLKQYSIVKCVTFPGTAWSTKGGRIASLQDFIHMEGQVQFEEWQDENTCNIIINDDAIFEGDETFFVHLSSPSYVIPGEITEASITIHDKEDEPSFEFSSEIIQVNETDQIARAVVKRSGDLTRSVSVICSTQSLSATGSSLKGLESGSDYVSRGEDNNYRIIFPAGVSKANCDVKLVDDSEYESMEQFEIKLSQPSLPATLGAIHTLIVVIEGPNDESFIFLQQEEYAYPEDSGLVDLAIVREGADLSHTSIVWCATRLSPTHSARPGQDYVPTSTKIIFGPDQSVQYCPLTLLDDEFEPRLEGNETFYVFLSSAIGSNLKQPIQATVVIYDDALDVPRMTFAQERYTVNENNKTVNISIVRQGDITLASSVVCYTRQKTAEVDVDYLERTLTNESRVYFKPGEKVKSCLVDILDDTSYEKDEMFLVKLGHPDGSNNSGAVLGDLHTAVISITDYDDEPRIIFDEASYSINEPSVMDQLGTVTLKVLRLGAVNGTAWVRCSTRDGSAVSGVDYNAKSLILHFRPGQRKLEFAVDVLYNTALEWHESFSAQLGPEVSTGTRIGNLNVATITIRDNEVSGSLALPAPPVVVSLLHYGNVLNGMKINPSPGYPVVCISSCDPQHPAYTTTKIICEDSKINQTAILYSWEVAIPPEDVGSEENGDGISSPFFTITDQTLFTFTDRKVLDSVHFRSFFRIRCVTQPLHENGHPGVPIKSLPVTIGHTNPICKAPSIPSSNRFNTFQAQSFLARLKYVEPGDDAHPNTLHISIQIPHQDGMLPLISTHPLHNLRLLLSNSLYRQQHICSNIIFKEEIQPMLGQTFLDMEDEDRVVLYGPGMDFPHQFDELLRSKETLQLYKHLNLKSCKWQFDAWYHMTELVDLCGGHILSDFQVKDESTTHLTVRVPLYVSYVFVTAPKGWSSMEHHSDMEFSFYYSTVMWSSGLETEERQEGRLQIVRILIEEDGKLVIEFRTQTKFRGLFVVSHQSLPDETSQVTAPESLTISFDLELVWSQATFDGPLQMWRAKSKYNLKDYTGVYRVSLVPCLVSPTQKFVNANPLPCAARHPERFEIPISFQQTNRPVPVSYSLNTEFQLGNSLDMFLSPPGRQEGAESDWDFSAAFSKGQRLYGRVLWDPDQDLQDGYQLVLDKVYLCTGRDGYTPTFDPAGEIFDKVPQYGCLQPSTNLLYRFLILDAESPEDQETQFQDVPFNAAFAKHDSRYKIIGNMAGVDGFAMDVDPLYKVNSGHKWYLQVVYTIGVADRYKYRQKRSPFSSYRSLIHKQYYHRRYNSYRPTAKSEVLDLSHKYKKMHKIIRAHQELHTFSPHSRSIHQNLGNALNQNNRNKRETNTSLIYSWKESYSNVASNARNGTNMQLVHLVFHTDSKPASSSLVFTPPFYIPVLIICILLVIVVFICVRKKVKHKDPQSLPSFINNLDAAKNNPHSVARVKGKTGGLNVDKAGEKIFTPSAKISNLCKSKEIIVFKEIKSDRSGTEV